MGLLNFIIVAVFNLFWYIKDGPENYKRLYNGGYATWLSVWVWLYGMWGFANLVVFISEQ